MNRAKLKSYAPQARRDFLRAVTDRARKVGLTSLHSEPVQVQGDVAIIAGQAFPKAVAAQRKRLDEQIQRKGFNAVMEEAAYTWFNRFMAIRYMEVHGYFEHGYRVLSHPAGGARPEILEQAEHVDLPGLDRAKVIDLKLDGTKDEELYKSLLLAQCRALHQAMPFLFERIDDATELLLPDGLLASDSLIRKMVAEILEEDWQQIEVIGWLYQFYISEKKDEVIGKVVKSEDIPAATQLFTPNWIVKYMVQNSLGAKWLATYPNSPLRGKMEYYIEPADQTEEVNAQLAVITLTSLDPETITLMDPACGSGHILVEAYDLFREIYLERGYRPRDIPRLILEKNLFGLDIDDRAAQMAGFAVLMKARAEDRRILQDVPCLNVRAIQSSSGLNAGEIADALLKPRRVELVANGELFPETRRQPPLSLEERPVAVSAADIREMLTLFADAKTFGSLMSITSRIATKIPHFRALLESSRVGVGLLENKAAADLEPLVAQAEFLARQYDMSVMNPPYMGTTVSTLKDYAKRTYPKSKSDLYAMFIERCMGFTKTDGYCAVVTMHSWMFLPAFEMLREEILTNVSICTLAHHGIGAFTELNSKVVQTCAMMFRNTNVLGFHGCYQDLRSGNEQFKQTALLNQKSANYKVDQNEFRLVPGSPIAYWLSKDERECFNANPSVGKVSKPIQGSTLGENEKYLRLWHEVSLKKTEKWRPCLKGGPYRRWYGNQDHVIEWSNDGYQVLNDPRATVRNKDLLFKPGVTWTRITSIDTSFRVIDEGSFCESASGFLTVDDHDRYNLLGVLNSRVASYFLRAINPTLTFNSGDIAKLPYIHAPVSDVVAESIEISKTDWNSYESARGFDLHPLLQFRAGNSLIQASVAAWAVYCEDLRQKLSTVEGRCDKIVAQVYGMEHVVEQEKSIPSSLRIVTERPAVDSLVSYALGCMMGRYGLDEHGLIYAHSGNQDFDPTRYATFPTDDDGILPLTDTDWFGQDDTANRFVAFVRVAWPVETLNENLTFVADSLGSKAGETAIDTIRRYLHTGFYKDHLQTYKKRPIYWLFTSGKERAFQALVYLHRYNEGTLSRMRIEYVIPLQSRISARIAQLDKDITAATSTADRKKRQNEKDKLVRQQAELLHFDEKLRHYADQRISLDLDDGVKVNYSRFGDLLAEVKAITGDKDE